MKFWKKIFLYSVTLFLVLLMGVGTLLVEKVYGENLQAAITGAINKYVDIEYTLYLNADYILGTDINDIKSMKNWLELMIDGYVPNDRLDQVYIEMYTKENEKIISNLNLNIKEERPELLKVETDKKHFMIRTIEGKHYVFISSMIHIRNRDIKFILTKDIQFVYAQRKADYQFLGIISIIVTSVLAVGMFIISKHLTKPIVSLSQITKEIASGNYSRRVIERKSNDEVGILEENFNMMIQQIENNIKALETVNESKQRFIDSLNHEIKTPITSIIGYSELLLRSKVNEETKFKALTYIHSEARRLEALNATLLKLILLREEKDVKALTSLSVCLKQVQQALSYALEKQEIGLNIQIEEKEVVIESKQLEILLINLIDNAIKASSKGGRIDIRGWMDGAQKCYILKISDYGIGIPEEDIDKIMEPFYMVDKARTRKYNGVGLGLAICHEICQNNHIDFKINSKVQEGTTISLVFRMETSNV